MFSGIIAAKGEVKRAEKTTLILQAKLPSVKPGDSVSVSGVCLTALGPIKKGKIAFDLSPETLRLTTFGRLRGGELVNLEPALKIGDALGGHLVSGHVDAVARVLERTNLPGGFARIRVEIPKEIKGLVAHKGSISVDGVSLTVSAIGHRYFEVALVPYTLTHTTLGGLRKGDQVNIEADMIARYVQSCLLAYRQVGARSFGESGWQK
jgi:riboflavin synthase